MNSLQAQDLCCGPAGLGPPNATPPAAARQCRITLAAAPESTRKARRFTTATLTRWQLGALIPDAVIIASELVTNAVRYGSAGAEAAQIAALEKTILGGPAEGCPVGVAWRYLPGHLTCVVTDASPTPPALVMPGPDAETGHGLQIVHALSTAWGWTMVSACQKAVWATLAAG